MNNTKTAPGMVVTDLDGTLLDGNRKISKRNLNTLLKLGQDKVLRVIATGRSLFSACKVMRDELPIDYLVFSSGAGIMHWPSQDLISDYSMNKQEVDSVFQKCTALDLDFMVHRPIPENHYFVYFKSSENNTDFDARIDIYKDFAVSGCVSEFKASKACQFVVIEPQFNVCSLYEHLSGEMNELNVIRTTSPIDGKSLWIEIFPKTVSKARASASIAELHSVEKKNILAVGNDYNDMDLLFWAQMSFLVGNAPEDIRNLFPTVASNNESGFSEAVSTWLNSQ